MSNLENTEGVKVEVSTEQDSSLDILSDLMLNPDKPVPVVEPYQDNKIGEVTDIKLEDFTVGKIEDFTVDKIEDFTVDKIEDFTVDKIEDFNQGGCEETTIDCRIPQKLSFCGRNELPSNEDSYGLDMRVEDYTQDDDLSRVYERMVNCRKNAIDKDIELQKINFVLETEGYTNDEINELYQSELQNNEELRNNIIEQADKLGWKGKSRMSDSPPRRRNRYVGLEKVENQSKVQATPNVQSDVPVVEEPKKESNLPPKGMYIPAKETIKAMFSSENDENKPQKQNNQVAKQTQKQDQNPTDLITPQDILKGEIINPNFGKQLAASASQSNNENLVKAIASCDKPSIRKYMNYNVDDVLKGIRAATIEQRKKIIRYLASICGELFIQHLLCAATEG